ncbi:MULTISPECIES: AraC family transcriptional regulator [Vibrio]|uniref:Helix-turn-helix transcriptional regulator n=1 Tax=Vibrio bivalvicida TaxID=1276888 RepID=A0ABV4MCB6_9VIBR|nr:helix-turn-helix domain-containing protein [Vibrio sp. VPAP30]KLN64900.1 AraC family transcriptional regulator [Vibrio sp. VPAP30]
MTIPQIAFNHNKANNAELEIFDLESLYQRKGLAHDPSEPHRVSFFALIFVQNGTGTHEVDFKPYPFKPGSIVFVQREQVQAFDFSQFPQGKMLIFTQAFLDQVHINMRLPNYTPTHLTPQHSPLLDLDTDHRNRVETLIDQMQQEMTQPSTDPLIVMYLFSALALILHRLRPEVPLDKLSDEQSTKFARFFEQLQANFHKTRDANWYANQLGTTYKTLNLTCKAATDLTAKQLIDAFTTLEIKRRLVVNQSTSQQLAYEFGFEDASNFVKFFKKHSQMTPGQFTKQHTTPKL